jgi:hypothetical protein
VGEQIAELEGARFPRLSPDGQYLFFVAPGGEAIMWVDAAVIEQFRP